MSFNICPQRQSFVLYCGHKLEPTQIFYFCCLSQKHFQPLCFLIHNTSLRHLDYIQGSSIKFSSLPMLLENVLVELLEHACARAHVCLLLHFKLRFDQSKIYRTWDYNSMPLTFQTSQVSVQNWFHYACKWQCLTLGLSFRGKHL